MLSYLVKPFQRSELIPAIEVALARFEELRSLDQAVTGLEDQLETRKAVDRAKGRLMDEHGMSEAEAFGYIQKSAMSGRSNMAEIAQRVIDGELPEAS